MKHCPKRKEKHTQTDTHLSLLLLLVPRCCGVGPEGGITFPAAPGGACPAHVSLCARRCTRPAPGPASRPASPTSARWSSATRRAPSASRPPSSRRARRLNMLILTQTLFLGISMPCLWPMVAPSWPGVRGPTQTAMMRRSVSSWPLLFSLIYFVQVRKLATIPSVQFEIYYKKVCHSRNKVLDNVQLCKGRCQLLLRLRVREWSCK